MHKDYTSIHCFLLQLACGVPELSDIHMYRGGKEIGASEGITSSINKKI
jgi:hypothetical protein